jgi:hypothetical protein
MLHVKKTPETRAKRTDWSFISPKKNKTPVISRSFNHQSKNEQFKLLLFFKFQIKDIKLL